MKRFFNLLFTLVLCTQGFCSDYFYYYNKERLELQIVENYLGLTMKNTQENLLLLENAGAIITACDIEGGLVFLKCPDNSVYMKIISICSSSNTIESFSPLFSLKDSEFLMAGTSRVMVTLNNKADTVLLNKEVQRHGFSIVYRDPYDSLFYVVNTNQRDGVSALDAAIQLHESNQFLSVSPDFLFSSKESGLYADDRLEIPPIVLPVLMDQWNFYNTSDTTVDINAQQAWQITNGDSNIIVAILDCGIELDHPALIDNLTPGYDAILNVYPAGSPAGTAGSNEHGTKCAGVIAAKKISLFGIKGLASESKVMPVRMTSDDEILLSSTLINAINFAYYSGASVINISLSLPPLIDTQNQLSLAHRYGRNGKGCIIVTVAGYDEETGMNAYPRNKKEAIVVGGTDKCGKRIGAHDCTTGSDCCASNAGDNLSLMAPGCAVPTTKRNHAYHLSECTSICAPQVCGVAALILSVNPDLTANQVRYIMESTAQKVGGYNYNSSPDHPNGTWNNEMGYGLVDAGAAVAMAQSLLSVPDVYIKDSQDDDGFEPNHENNQLTNSPDIWLTQNGLSVNQVTAGQTYQVHVRVHNLSSSSTGLVNLTVSWCLSGEDLLWNHHWTSLSPICGLQRHGKVINNCTIWGIPSHSDYTMTFDWTAPSPNNNICILSPTTIPLSFVATINDGRITVGQNSSDLPIDDFVRENNNVAMKRMSFSTEILYPIIHLSPNPTHGLLTVSWDDDMPQSSPNMQILISDIYGHVLLNQAINADARNAQVNITNFPSGRYIVSITDNNQIISSEELIIN